MEKNIFEKNFVLRISDFTCYDKLKPSMMLDFFQDVAGQHADILGIGFNDLIQKDLIWVLLRTKYEVIKEPKPYTEVKVKTWPHEKGRLDFDRDYLITDQDDNVLIKGTSKWVVVNYKTRRLSLNQNINYDFIPLKDKNYEEPFNKLEDFTLDEASPFFEYQTLFTDLDHNGHVNNIKFADFILNGISLQKDENIVKFEIDYLKELKQGSIIKNYFLRKDNIIYVKGVSDNINIYLAKITLN